MKTSNKLSQIAFIITREFRAISTSYAVLLVLMGGIFVYGLLYNYMYAPNIVTKAPVAVVDNSHSSLSRQYIRWLSATPQVEIYAQAMDYHEAQEWMKQGKVQGILYLPHNFEDRVFQGEEAVFSLYATTDAFLYFEALQEASSRVMLAINDAYRPDGAVFLPPQGLIAVALAKPVNVSGTALYNYTEGYGFLPYSGSNDGHHLPNVANGYRHGDGRRIPEQRCPCLSSFRSQLGNGNTHRCRKNVCLLQPVCRLCLFSIRLVTTFFQHPEYRQRQGYPYHAYPLSVSNQFFRAGRFMVFHRFGSSLVNDRLLFGRLNFPLRCILSDGTDALVLAGSTLHLTGRSGHTRFCETELNGRRHGGYPTGIHHIMDTDSCLLRACSMGLPKETLTKYPSKSLNIFAHLCRISLSLLSKN